MVTTRRTSVWLAALAVAAPLALSSCGTEATPLEAAAEQLGCSNDFRASPVFAGAQGGDCRLDGGSVLLTDWNAMPEPTRSSQIQALSGFGMHAVKFDHVFTASGANRDLLQLVRNEFGGRFVTAGSPAKPAVVEGEALDAPPPCGPDGVCVGQAFTNDGFEVTVTDVELDGEVIDQGEQVKPENGQFVVVHLDVTNDGKHPDMFSNTASTLIDDQGRHFTVSTMYLGLRGDESGEEFQPGTGGSIVIPFDVPSDVTGVAGVEVQPEDYFDTTNPTTYVSNES